MLYFFMITGSIFYFKPVVQNFLMMLCSRIYYGILTDPPQKPIAYTWSPALTSTASVRFKALKISAPDPQTTVVLLTWSPALTSKASM
jgi:hypothetical protein